MRGASLVVIACQGHSRNRTQSRDKHFDKKWAEMFFDQIYKNQHGQSYLPVENQ